MLNCATTHLSVGWFRSRQGGGRILERLQSKELSYDFSVEGNWLPSVAGALRQFRDEGALGGAASFILPSFKLLTKVIRVPLVKRGGQGRAIAYEVQQNIPYPLSEVVWDFHVLNDDGVEMEVMISAEKRESNDAFCRVLEELQIHPVGMFSSSALDYCRLVGFSRKGGSQVILLNVGARTSNLLMLSDERLFVRQIPIGGNRVSESLAGLTEMTFVAAEDCKKRYFSGSMEEAGRSFPVAEIGESSARFTKRLGVEVGRSLASATGERSGGDAATLFLCGRGSLLPGLAAHVQKSLNLRVERCPPLAEQVSDSSLERDIAQDDLERNSELLGAAWAGARSETPIIDLLPAERRRAQRLDRRKPYFIAAGLMLLVALGIPMLHYRNLAVEEERVRGEVEGLLSPLEENLAAIAAVRDRANMLSLEIDSLDRILRGRSVWTRLLADLQRRLHEVEDVWLEEFEVVDVVPDAVGESMQETADGPSAPGRGRRLRLAGRMIDRVNPLSKVSENVQERVGELLRSFQESEFISAVQGARFDASENGLLRFEFVMEMEAEQPF